MVRHSRRLVFTPERLPPFFGRPGRDLPRAQSATDDITEDARDNPAESRVNFTELGLPFPSRWLKVAARYRSNRWELREPRVGTH